MADDSLLLGIDIGTSGVKAAAFDLDGTMQCFGQSQYITHYVGPGSAEQDPNDWWSATREAIREVLSQLPRGAERIIGLAVSSQAPTLLALDADGRPVRPALIWMDRRATKQAAELKDTLGAPFIEQVTGNRIDPFYVASKLAWFRQEEPHRYQRTRVFLQVNGYVNYRLTGKYSLDHTHSGLLQLIDQHTGQWSLELCKACGVTPEQFPPISPDHQVIGHVTREAALCTGLVEGTPVVAGTVDSAAAAIEAGAVREGIVAEMTGTSTVLILPRSAVVSDQAFISMPHAVAGQYLSLAAVVSSGANLKWFRDQFGQSETRVAEQTGVDPFDLLTMQAERVLPGSEGVIFLPYMMGERSPIWDSNARGVFFGLSLSTPRGAIIRAILEGTAYSLLHNVNIARASGADFSEIRSVGGGSKSALWNQIKADVLGLPVALPESSTGAVFGDAVLAGLGVGVYNDVENIVRKSVTIKSRYLPDMNIHRAYLRHYDFYLELYEQLRLTFARRAKENAEGIG